MKRLILNLAECFDSLGLYREAASLRELVEFKQQPTTPEKPSVKKPQIRLPSGYRLEQETPDQFIVRGPLYRGPISQETADEVLAQIGARERLFSTLPRKSRPSPEVAIVNAPAMDLIFADGHIQVRPFRKLEPESQAFADMLQNEEPNWDVLEFIRESLQTLQGVIRPEHHPTENKLINLASVLAIKGRIEFPLYANVTTIQEDLRPYLDRRLPPQLAVKSRRNMKNNTIVLTTYNRMINADREPPQHGLWVHVLNTGVGEKGLEGFLNEFRNIEGEISVSDVRDFHFVMPHYYLALMLEGTPRAVYQWDVGSKVDPWTGRRVADPRKTNVSGKPRTEAFLVPQKSRITAIITDTKKYSDQAKKMGYPVYTNPAAFNTSFAVQTSETIKQLAVPWPSAPLPPAAETYLLTAPEETTDREGFLTPELVEWIRTNDGQIPGGGRQQGDQWNPGFWDKKSGIMVIFPQRPSSPPADQGVEIKRVQRPPAVFSYPLPHNFFTRIRNDAARQPARLRRLVIQQGEPFSINKAQNTVVTTPRGFHHFKNLFARPPALPKRFS